jgi:hypothetical protein
METIAPFAFELESLITNQTALIGKFFTPKKIIKSRLLYRAS